MFYFQLKAWIYTLMYMLFSFVFIFIINLYYIETYVYYIYLNLLNITEIFAINYYEILFANLFLTFFLSLLYFLPISPIFIIIYFVTGLFKNELKKIKKIWRNQMIIYIIDTTLLIKVVLPIMFYIEKTNIIQIYTYGNITKLIIKIIIIWLIWSNIYLKIKNKRKEIPIIIIILNILIIPPIIEIQIKIIMIIIIYTEIRRYGEYNLMVKY